MKARIFAAAAAGMLGLTYAFPVCAANSQSAMKKAVYHAHFGKGQAFYEELSDRWYRVTGEPLTDDEPFRFRSSKDGFTCDPGLMIVYNPDGTENAALSITCKDLMTSEIFTFTQYNGEPIYADTQENMLAQRMRASLPVTRELILEDHVFRCLFYANSMPIMSVDASFDDAFKITSVDYEHYGDIRFESYTNSGDVNLDGRLTVSDAVILARVAAEDENVRISELGLTLSDLTADGLTDFGDVTAALRTIAGLSTDQINNPPAESTGTAVTTTVTEITTSTTCTTTTTATTDNYYGTPEEYLTVEYKLTAVPTRQRFMVGEPIDISDARFSAKFVDPFRQIQFEVHNALVSDYPEIVKVEGPALTAAEPGIYDLNFTFAPCEALGSGFDITRTATVPIVIYEPEPAATSALAATSQNEGTTTTTTSAIFATSSSTTTTTTAIHMTEYSETTEQTVTIPPIATLPILTE